MNKHIIKIVLTVIALFILGVAIYYVYNGTGTKEEGNITIIVVDETGTEIINDDISYNEGTTMLTILNENYDVEVDNGFLIRFETLEARDPQIAFIKIYIDDQASQRGVGQMKFKDGNTIKFVYTEIGS